MAQLSNKIKRALNAKVMVILLRRQRSDVAKPYIREHDEQEALRTH